MAVNLSPIWGAGAQLLDNSGNVLTGGKIYTYLAGTTTPATTYTSSDGATANSNPIILNSAGRVPYEIWLTDSVEYKFVLKDSNDTLIGTWDNLVGINSNFINYYGQQEIQTATAGQTVFTLADFEYQPNTGNLSVFVDGVNQYGPGAQYAYVETDATTITFVSGLHVGASVKFTTTKLENPTAVDASQVSYTYPDANAVSESVEHRLSQFILLTDFGAVCDGITDDTTAIQSCIASIGSDNVDLIVTGPTKFSSTLTFNPNTQLVFQNGAYFVGNAGTEVINVQRQPLAGPTQIFSNCKPTANTGMNCMPEWFGAKADGSTDSSSGIQAAITFIENVGGEIKFGSGIYNMSTVVTIGNNTTGGSGSKTVLNGVGPNVTILKTTGASVSAIQILGISANPCRTVAVKNLSVTKSVAPTGGVGIYANQTTVLQIVNVNVADYLYGIQLNNATNTNCDNVYVTISGTANTWRGFFLQGDAPSGNASSYFNKCFVDGRNNSGTGGIGFYSIGAYSSDLAFFECETSFGDSGWYLDFTSSALNGNEDVQLIQCRADAFKNTGIYMTGAGSSGSSDSMITIIGGWFNARSTGAETNSIRMTHCRGVNICEVQFYNDTNYANGNHVKMDNCQDIIINACLFTSMHYGVYADTCEYCVISSNRFWNQSGRTASGYVNMTGCVRSMVNSNSFDGYATYAVYVDNTSQGCGIVGNTVNASTLTNRFANNSTGPVGGADGTLGLNSGA